MSVELFAYFLHSCLYVAHQKSGAEPVFACATLEASVWLSGILFVRITVAVVF